MHEMSVAASVIEIAEEQAREKGASKIISVTLNVGDLSGVMAEAVAFCYEACAKGTLAENSRLIINKVTARAFCPQCEKEFTPGSRFVICPSCSGFARITAGEDLSVERMEVE